MLFRSAWPAERRTLPCRRPGSARVLSLGLMSAWSAAWYLLGGLRAGRCLSIVAGRVRWLPGIGVRLSVMVSSRCRVLAVAGCMSVTVGCVRFAGLGVR